MSISATATLPHPISTTKDSTKIYKTPIEFKGQDFFSTATQWTKKHIFSNGSANGIPNGGNRPPTPILSPASTSPPQYDQVNGSEIGSGSSSCIEFGPSGEIIIGYPSVVQLWEYSLRLAESSGGGYKLSGTTNGLEGKVISVSLVPSIRDGKPEETANSYEQDNAAPKGSRLVAVQVVRRRSTYLEIHALNQKPSLVRTLVIPPSSSGPSPYHIYTRNTSKYITVVTANGLITVFSALDFHPLPLSGLQTNITDDGLPLLDISGRWLAFSPQTPPSSAAQTPLKLPASGPLFDRIVESLSSTAAASLKSLADASMAGIKQYLSTGKDTNGSDRTGNGIPGNRAVSGNGTIRGANRKNSQSTAHSSTLSVLSSMLLSNSNSLALQIVDIPTQSTICSFTPLYGLSYLSLSPHDATLATVSAKGEFILTFDLSFVPVEASLTGKYIRGKTSAKVQSMAWDSFGGFGIVTSQSGSLHWFDKRRSLHRTNSNIGSSNGGLLNGVSNLAPESFSPVNNTNKIWRLSGWGIANAVTVPDFVGKDDLTADSNGFLPSVEKSVGPSSDKWTNILALKGHSAMVIDTETGECAWKYDLPRNPIAGELMCVNGSTGGSEDYHEDILDQQEIEEGEKDGYDLHSGKMAEPLSFYEIETTTPYPFIHNDRRVVLSTFENTSDSGENNHDNNGPNYEHLVNNKIFGQSIKYNLIDFGRARGQAKFSPQDSDQETEEGIKVSDSVVLQQAMESMVLFKNGSAKDEKTDSIVNSIAPIPEDDNLAVGDY